MVAVADGTVQIGQFGAMFGDGVGGRPDRPGDIVRSTAHHIPQRSDGVWTGASHRSASSRSMRSTVMLMPCISRLVM